MAPELSDRDEGVSIPRVACPSQSGCRSFGEAAVQRADYQLWNLWFLGRYRSSLSSALESLGQLSENVQKKGHLLTFSAVTFRCLRLPERALEVLDILKEMIETTGIEGWQPSNGVSWMVPGHDGVSFGNRSAEKGRRPVPGLQRMGLVKYLAILAEDYLACSNARRGRGIVNLALKFSKRSGTVFFDADLWRLKGEAALLEGGKGDAAVCFRTALEIERKRGARPLSFGQPLAWEGFS